MVAQFGQKDMMEERERTTMSPILLRSGSIPMIRNIHAVGSMEESKGLKKRVSDLIL